MLERLERLVNGDAKYEEPVTAFLTGLGTGGGGAVAAGTLAPGTVGIAASSGAAIAGGGIFGGLTAGTVALGVAGASAVGGLVQGRKAAKAQKRQSALQQRLADLRNQRQRRQAIRQARIARAQVVAGGEQAGIGLGSSAVQGGTGAVGSQVGANLSFLDEASQIQGSIFAQGQKAASAQGAQAAFGSVQSLATPFAKPAFKKLGKSIFG